MRLQPERSPANLFGRVCSCSHTRRHKRRGPGSGAWRLPRQVLHAARRPATVPLSADRTQQSVDEMSWASLLPPGSLCASHPPFTLHPPPRPRQPAPSHLTMLAPPLCQRALSQLLLATAPMCHSSAACLWAMPTLLYTQGMAAAMRLPSSVTPLLKLS